ncbi:helix-turn-helix transcriptional regulator [Pararhizobium sp. YC-54]|uniref:winged helix-turn-helix transcriptional regulator n=1 Tax=Pararhizobium sp. YC-54 TaxID=2986920 RepID=UPI0021F7BDE6|nr:helix-turn-helix domain-containing protein [Pararhizobium sp. YC-54]MCV9999244.1 helix-turn-helix transcriptional regulator [Pararhizobium sp. YC-54]
MARIDGVDQLVAEAPSWPGISPMLPKFFKALEEIKSRKLSRGTTQISSGVSPQPIRSLPETKHKSSGTAMSEKPTLDPTSTTGDADDRRDQSVLNLFDVICNRWTVMLIGVLSDGPASFDAITRDVAGMHYAKLASALHHLERHGCVARRPVSTALSAFEYELTERGRSSIGPLEGIVKWVHTNHQSIDNMCTTFDAKNAVRKCR